MAIFKVGQRVRVVHQDEATIIIWGDVRGREGVIVDFAPTLFHCDCRMLVDGDTSIWNVATNYLAPLTDPSADAFIASIKAMKPYEEPKVGKKEEVKHG